ncbi:hypothetical protein DFQ27_008560 [Actinomortierella ambigua]|uniref:Uncharacterized protein n=1 Tax=Actinomortierella ambigua TaxID=1343610 RepID=A0A9P6PTN8_9FUNG|nr:hypothetical protein DFQ27_008560 [Actinomortierella ambigua]
MSTLRRGSASQSNKEIRAGPKSQTNYAEALLWFRKSADQRNADAQCGLEPGPITGRFIADLAVEGLSKRQQGKTEVKTASKSPQLPETKEHVNSLRPRSFDPRTYDEDGYVLPGSIETDGPSPPLRELQSVRYRRYKSKLHPDFRTSTIGGTDGYLAKVRNDVKTEQDLIDRWVFDETKWTKSQTSG